MSVGGDLCSLIQQANHRFLLEGVGESPTTSAGTVSTLPTCAAEDSSNERLSH